VIRRLKHGEVEQLLWRRAVYDCLQRLHSRCSMFGGQSHFFFALFDALP
jgi:hypothetical protein